MSRRAQHSKGSEKTRREHRKAGGDDQKRPDVAVLSGRRPVREALLHASKRIQTIYYSSAEVIAELLNGIDGENRFSTHLRTNEELDELAPGANHQGIVAFVEPLAEISLEELAKKAKQSGQVIIALDGVQDPHNLGAVLRACEATGVAGIVLPADRSTSLTAVARRVSVGASELIPIHTAVNLRRALQDLKQAGYWIVGTDVGAAAQNVFDAELPFPLVLVLGSEGSGIRRGTRDECDLLVHIPMFGVLDSLNVSQSAAVFLYEIVRQQKRSAGQ